MIDSTFPATRRSEATIVPRAINQDVPAIAVRNLAKRFGRFKALDGVSFEVPEGRLVALVGPSGSGKSTILRMIAGLESADAGEVELAGKVVTGLPSRRRGIGFVFQHYALFRHMTIRRNIAFGLEVRKLPSARSANGLTVSWNWCNFKVTPSDILRSFPAASGSAVSLARALAPEPKVLLLDEPFGALDAKVREELRTWLRRLHDETGVTSLFVTHDRQEMFEIADQAVVIHQGKVEQVGLPQELYDHPASLFVAEFLGAVNVLRADLMRGMGLNDLEAAPRRPSSNAADPALIHVRPHDLDVERHRNGRPCWARASRSPDPARRPCPTRPLAARRQRPICTSNSPASAAAMAL